MAKKSKTKEAPKDIIMPMESVESKKRHEAMEAEDDANQLLRSEKIRKDAKRHEKAMDHLKNTKDSIKSLEQLKKIAADRIKELSED